MRPHAAPKSREGMKSPLGTCNKSNQHIDPATGSDCLPADHTSNRKEKSRGPRRQRGRVERRYLKKNVQKYFLRAGFEVLTLLVVEQTLDTLLGRGEKERRHRIVLAITAHKLKNAQLTTVPVIARLPHCAYCTPLNTSPSTIANL